MGNSLQDQLLNAGLTDKKKAKAVAKESRKKKNTERRIKTDSPQLTEAQKQAQEKKARDRAMNLERQQAAEEKAIQAQIIQLIEHYQLKNTKGDVDYNFSDNTTIKRLSVSQSLSDDISAGRICIVRLKDAYALIPKPIAEKIAERDSSSIVVANTKASENTQEDDDYYAQFEIPDDLMW